MPRGVVGHVDPDLSTDLHLVQKSIENDADENAKQYAMARTEVSLDGATFAIVDVGETSMNPDTGMQVTSFCFYIATFRFVSRFFPSVLEPRMIKSPHDLLATVAAFLKEMPIEFSAWVSEKWIDGEGEEGYAGGMKTLPELGALRATGNMGHGATQAEIDATAYVLQVGFHIFNVDCRTPTAFLCFPEGITNNSTLPIVRLRNINLPLWHHFQCLVPPEQVGWGLPTAATPSSPPASGKGKGGGGGGGAGDAPSPPSSSPPASGGDPAQRVGLGRPGPRARGRRGADRDR